MSLWVNTIAIINQQDWSDVLTREEIYTKEISLKVFKLMDGVYHSWGRKVEFKLDGTKIITDMAIGWNSIQTI